MKRCECLPPYQFWSYDDNILAPKIFEAISSSRMKSFVPLCFYFFKKMDEVLNDWHFFDDPMMDIIDPEEDEDFKELANLILSPRAVRRFPERFNYFLLSDDHFLQRFRLSKDVVRYLVNKIGNEIRPRTMKNHAVTPEQQILFTLRFYASGTFLITCGDFVGISKATGSHIIRRVSRALARLAPQFINFPENEAERNLVAQRFHNILKFPHCLGAIDCTHVRIRLPGGENAEIFQNRKGWFSINVQTVCDADLRIENVVARWPGSTHDSLIFRNSNLQQRFEGGHFDDFLIVGDSGYAVTNYLLTPLQNPSNRAQDLYNESLIMSHNTVERSYGLWKRRFPVLATGIQVNIRTVDAIIVACAVLHNIAVFYGVHMPRVTEEEEKLISETIFDAESIPISTQNDPFTAKEITQRQLINYFQMRLDAIDEN